MRLFISTESTERDLTLPHGSPASAALTTQSPTSRLPSTPAPVVVYALRDQNGWTAAAVAGKNTEVAAPLAASSVSVGPDKPSDFARRAGAEVRGRAEEGAEAAAQGEDAAQAGALAI